MQANRSGEVERDIFKAAAGKGLRTLLLLGEVVRNVFDWENELVLTRAFIFEVRYRIS